MHDQPRRRVPAHNAQHGLQPRRDAVQHKPPGAATGQLDHGPQSGQIAVLQVGQIEMNLGAGELGQLLDQGRVGILVDLAGNGARPGGRPTAVIRNTPPS